MHSNVKYKLKMSHFRLPRRPRGNDRPHHHVPDCFLQGKVLHLITLNIEKMSCFRIKEREKNMTLKWR